MLGLVSSRSLGSKAIDEAQSERAATQVEVEMAKRGVEWLGVGVFGAMAAGTAGLGVWQVQRYGWKVGLVEERRRMLAQDAVPLGQASRPYERVACRGRFRYADSMLVGPRSPPEAAGGALAPSGFFVVTPFEDESGGLVLVNRGWIPRGKDEMAFADEGETSFEGVLGQLETRGAFTPDKGGEFFFALDDALRESKALPEDTKLVDRVDGPGPVLSKTTDSMQSFKVHPFTHIGYAATWFGLSGAALVFIRKRFFRA